MPTPPGKIFIATKDNVCVVKLVGDIRVTLCASLDATVDRIIAPDKTYQDILINLAEADAIDSTSLGLLAKISLVAKERYGYIPTIISTNPSITKLLKSIGFDNIFNILTSLDQESDNLDVEEQKFPGEWTEEEIKCKVIEAHKLLMSLNQENKEAFRELVDKLEQC
jgi:anti-anti-sigma factor